jgi:hypothetical protein
MTTSIMERQRASVSMAAVCPGEGRGELRVLPSQGEVVWASGALMFSACPLVSPLLHIWIASLPDDRLRLMAPLSIEVTRDQSGFIAECKKLDEFGYGSEVIDSVEDLRETICELFWELQDGRDLAPGLVSLSRTIHDLVRTA